MKNTISQEQINDTAVSLGIPTIPFFQRRIARAYDLVETNKVNEISHDDGLYRVHSQYDDKIYTVEINHGNPNCTCPDGKKTVFCKHMIASMLTAFEATSDKLTIYDDTFDKRKGMEGKRNSKYGRWIVNDYNVRKGYVVYRDEHRKLHCACGKKNCRHCKAIRKVTDDGAEGFARDNTAMRIENECGTSEAKTLQDKLNGNNGTGDTQSPIPTLDTSDPFQEAEALDIDQIEGRAWRVRSHALGDLVHKLSNGKYVISYHGIMKLADKHGVTFEAARHDETRTVIAYGHRGGNSRASGKPINGSEMTALELAKRNTARQLLPLPEIKALEHKAKLEAEFSWEKAKAKCLELVPGFTLDILINDMVRDGKLEQKHSSDYSRREWLLIFDACKRDAETNGNDDDGGNNTPSSELIKASKLYSDEAFQKRILRACLTLDAPAPVKVLNWLGNEYFGYRNRPILYYFCAAGQLNRIDIRVRSHAPSNRKLRHIIVTRDTAETELDAHALAQMAVDVAEPSEQKAEVPDNADEFIARCKEMESEVDDPAPMVEVSRACDRTRLNGDGKRMLRMDKKKNILLIEPDGTETPITMRDAAFTYGSNFILRLTTGIACGGDISTVELD